MAENKLGSRGGFWPFRGSAQLTRQELPAGPGPGLSLPLHSLRTLPKTRGESRSPPGTRPRPRGPEGKGVAGRGEAGARAAGDSRTGCGSAAGARPPAGQKRGLSGRKDPRRRGTSEASLGCWRTDSMVAPAVCRFAGGLLTQGWGGPSARMPKTCRGHLPVVLEFYVPGWIGGG